MSPIYGYVTKLFLESEIQHKGYKQTKKTRIVSKILRFSWQEQIQKIKIFKYYTERIKNTWTILSSLGQEPTFNYALLWENQKKKYDKCCRYL